MSSKRRTFEQGSFLPNKNTKRRGSHRIMNGSTIVPINSASDVLGVDLPPIRRGRSADNLERSMKSKHEKSTHKSTNCSKENHTPSCSTSQKVVNIPVNTEQRVVRQAAPITRQRPATYHVMASNLHRQMRENCQRWCQRVVRDKGVEGLKNEFSSLKKSVDPNAATMFMQQPPNTKNRYRDVICLDKTRVVLKNTEDDYIHANYVSAPQSEKRFICTQAPTDNTCGDFWRMVVQEKSSVIVMLCNFYEKQMKKCSEYVPTKLGESLTFDGNITVTCRTQKILELPKECTQKIAIRVSGLSIVFDNNTNNPHFCDHYAWIDWPDRGVPGTDLTAINVLNVIRPCKYPIIIHCSAGVGRTGTIVMIEYVLELFLSGKPFEKSDEILNKIREQRSMSIQTAEQYLYVHRLLLEYFYRLNLLEPEQLPHIRKFVEDYNKATHT